MYLCGWRILSETASLPPKVGIRFTYTLSSGDLTNGIRLAMLLRILGNASIFFGELQTIPHFDVSVSVTLMVFGFNRL